MMRRVAADFGQSARRSGGAIPSAGRQAALRTARLCSLLRRDNAADGRNRRNPLGAGHLGVWRRCLLVADPLTEYAPRSRLAIRPSGRSRGASGFFNTLLGFTLIELLVVIAIVATLAALLLPALRNAKAQAKRVGCVNNLRQIATAMMTYANDYDGYVPGSTYNNSREYSPNCLTPASAPTGPGLLSNLGYLKDPNVIYCPGRKPGDRYTAKYGGAEGSYYVATTNKSPNDGYDFSSWHCLGTTDPSKVLAFDLCIMSCDPNSPQYPNDEPFGATRHHHGTGYNFAFFDGSVRWVPDPTAYLENTFYYYSDMPWRYDNANLIYYIHTTFFGWKDHTQR